jgi:hypothetical protein
VTVVGGPPLRSVPPRRPVSRRTVWAAILVVVLVLPGSGVLSEVRDAQTRSRHRTAAQLRVSLAGSGSAPANVGVANSAVQEARVLVDVRNDSPFAVHVFASVLDGAVRRQATTAAAGTVLRLPVDWRIRCAEVGLQAGPRMLTLRVEARDAQRDLQIALPPYDGRPGLGRTFHLAAVQACQVLVTGGG